MEEMQKDKPSAESSYWAKESCKYCHGRGVIGGVTRSVGNGNTIKQGQLCVCAQRNWKKWQEGWLEARKPKRSDSKKELTEEERFQLVRPRLEKIDERIAVLQSEMAVLDVRISEMPQHGVISGFGEQLHTESVKLDGIADTMEEHAIDRDRAEKEADRLLRESKEQRRYATQAQQKYEEERAVWNSQRAKINNLEAEQRRVQSELNRASHSTRKKQREAARRLSRLIERRSRIIRENRVESRIRQNYIQLSDIKEETPDESIDNSEHVG
jgi:hypothetical protein